MTTESPTATDRPERLLRRRVVLDRCGGIQYVTLWRWIDDGHFPMPVRLNPSGTLLAWRESDVNDWIASRPIGEGDRPNAAIEARRQRVAERRSQQSEPRLVRRRRVEEAGQ